MLYLAIDQHSNQLTVNLRSESGDVILRRQVSTKPKLVRRFFEKLADDSSTEGGYVAILEVCGFNDWLLSLLRESWTNCRKVLLIQPEKRGKQKTDRRDADSLCQVLWVNRERLLAGKRVQNARQVHPATTEEAADRQLTALRRHEKQRLTEVLGKVWRILHKHNLQHDMPTKGIQTKTARKWLAKLKLPSVDRLELDHLLEQWDLLERQLEQVDRTNSERHARSNKAQLASTMPGLAVYGGLAIASRVGDIERFPCGASLANFFGLAPGCRNSGNTQGRMGGITKRGSSMVRFLLGQAVIHVLRKDAWMRRWYQQVKRRRGSKVARVAVMRRLATILWSMFKYNMPYIRGGPEEFRKALAARDNLQQERPQAATV